MKAERLWTRDFARVTGTHLLLFLGFLMVTPVLPVYLTSFTSDEGLIGAAVGVFTFSAVAVRMWIGSLVDRYGRRQVLQEGLVWFALATALYAVTDSVVAVFMVRMLHGAGYGAATTATGAMAADVVPGTRRAEGMGFFGGSVSVAQALGPVLGFAAVNAWGRHAAFYAGTVVALLALALARSQRETASRLQRQPHPAFEPAALVPSALTFLVTMTAGGVLPLIPLYTLQLGVANPGPFYTILAVSVLAVRPLAGATADRLSPPLVAGAGLVCGVAALLVIGRFPGVVGLLGLPVGVALGALVLGFALGAFLPVAQAVAVARTPRDRWGGASATFYAALDLGIGAGAFLVGWLASGIGLGSAYTASAALPLLGLLLLVATRRAWSLRTVEPAPREAPPATD